MQYNSIASFTRILLFCVLISIAAVFSRGIIVCRICVILIFGLCILLGRNEPKFFNPFYLFSITPFSLLIYTNLSSSIMMDLNHDTWSIAVMNMAAFIVAVYYARIRTKDAREHTGQSSENLARHAFILIVIFSFASIFKLLVYRILPFSSLFIVCGIPAIICALMVVKCYLSVIKKGGSISI